MRILAIETSTSNGSLAVAEDGVVLAEERFQSERGHNTAIFGPLAKVLVPGADADADADGIGRIVVGTGPGSYSGVRVGIAVANALSITYGVPVAGVPSILAPGKLEVADYWVTGDARRQSWFLARVRAWRVSGEIDLMPLDELGGRVRSLLDCGETVVTFDEKPPVLGDGIEIRTESPEAGTLALRAAGLSGAELAALEETPVQPIYLRAPYITKPKTR